MGSNPLISRTLKLPSPLRITVACAVVVWACAGNTLAADDSAQPNKTTTNAIANADAGNTLTPEQSADLELWRAGLLESSNPIAQQNAAAKLLQSNWDQSLDILSHALQNTEKTEVITAICNALRAGTHHPKPLLAALIKGVCTNSTEIQNQYLNALAAYPAAIAIPKLVAIAHDQTHDTAQRICSIDALSRYFEVEVVDALILCLQPDEPEVVHNAAQNALERVSGVTYLEPTLSQWQEWWLLNRDNGREGLLDANVRHLQKQVTQLHSLQSINAHQNNTLTQKLRSSVEQTYLLTPTQDRSVFLVDLLTDEMNTMQSLGLRFIQRAVSNAESVTADVVQAIANCTKDDSPEVRAAAFHQLAFLDGQQATTVAITQFRSETDTVVRGEMLATILRQPSAEAWDTMQSLLMESTPNERAAAAAVLLSLMQQGIGSPEQRQHIGQRVLTLDRLDNTVPPQFAAMTESILTPSEIELLAWSGIDGSIERVAAYLEWDPQSISNGDNSNTLSPDRILMMDLLKEAAARGLADSCLGESVLRTFSTDASIYPYTIHALQNTSAPIDLLRIILFELDPPNEIERITQVHNLMTDFTPEDWLAADDLLVQYDRIDIKTREHWLTRIFQVNGVSNETDIDTQNESQNEHKLGLDGLSKRAIYLRLVELRLALLDPVGADIALKAAPIAESDQDRESHLRTIIAIALGQFDGLTAENTTPNDWFDALDMLIRMDPVDVALVQSSVAIFETTFADQLSNTNQARLTAILDVVQNVDPDATQTPIAASDDTPVSVTQPSAEDNTSGG